MHADEIKSELNLCNRFYHLFWNDLSSYFLSKIVTFNMYRTVIVGVVIFGCASWSVTSRLEQSVEPETEEISGGM